MADDPLAREVVESAVYPPILRARDEILPRTAGGRTVVRDFQRHMDEAVSIMGRDPALFVDVIRYMTALGPFARALGGDVIASRPSASSYTAARLRPGMVDWTKELLTRFETRATPELAATIKRYQGLMPSLQNLTPAEMLAALDDRQLSEQLERG